MLVRLFSHYFLFPFVSFLSVSLFSWTRIILYFIIRGLLAILLSAYPPLSLARSLSHQFHIFSAPSFSFPLRFSFFLCEVAVGGMAGRRGSPEGILGAEVPVIHYPACFSLWQACDRVLLRHRHTRSCIWWSALRLRCEITGHTHHTASHAAARGSACTCNDIQYSAAVFLITHVSVYLYVSVCVQVRTGCSFILLTPTWECKTAVREKTWDALEAIINFSCLLMWG